MESSKIVRKGVQLSSAVLVLLLTGVIQFGVDVAYAATNTWGFTSSSDYTVSSSDIEFAAGVAQLKATSSPSWYNSGWEYRKAITIDSTKVDSDLSNFAVLVSLTDANLSSGAQSDGDDILFTSADGTTKLSHEIESYTTATGELISWVKIPTLASATDTVLYMYYGNSAATDQSDTESVWTSDYRAVQHMNEDPSGAAPQMVDSTTNNQDGTSSGSMSSADLVSAKIGKGTDFDGTDDQVDVEDVSTGSASLKDFEVPGGFTNTGLVYDAGEDVLWSGNFTDSSIVKMTKDGALLSSIAVFTATGIQGVALDTSDDTLWYADYGSSTIYHINKSGTALGTITVSVTGGGNGVAYEAATDSLWVLGPTDAIIKRYSASTGAEIESLDISAAGAAFDGIAYDSSDDTIWVTQDNDNVYNINTTTGAVVSNFTTEKGNIEHIALDPTDNTVYINHDTLFHSAVPNGNRTWQYNKLAGIDRFSSFDSFTVSAWIYPTDVTNAKGAQVIAEYLGSTMLFGFFIRSTGVISTYLSTATNSAAGEVVNNTWYHLVSTYDGSTVKLYKNGVQVASGANTRVPSINDNMVIGMRKTDTLGFIGIIDEVKVSDIVASADAISTQYYNQNSPATFYSVGTQQVLYSTAVPTVQPKASESLTFTSLSGFTESATKNGGEIKYIISNDDGASWQYYNSGWATANGTYSQTNIATDINTNIGTFPVGDGNFLFKAFLSSDGSQLVQLDQVDVTFAVNLDPTDIQIDSASTDSVDENIASGTIISAFSTTDADVADVHTYSLVAGTGDTDNGNFSVNGTNLQIDFIPDYETKTSYSIRVQTDDGNGGLYARALTITINDLGEGGGGTIAGLLGASGGLLDSDGDGVSDVEEIKNGTDPNKRDVNVVSQAEISFLDSLRAQIAELTKRVQKMIAGDEVITTIKKSELTEQECPVFTKFYKEGDNNQGELKKIQEFLMTEGLFDYHTATGYYGPITDKGIRGFQLKYAADILEPWGETEPTGYWYKTTRKKANELAGCVI